MVSSTLLFMVHLMIMVSVFEVYFRSPIIENIETVQNPMDTHTKRIVLIVGDGLSAEYLYDYYASLNRTPYLRSVLESKGAWGVSHTRVPTESRPGHVALIAGFYEDPSAVFKGWKENLVDFDSVFNQSGMTISWGSPDIVPMFSRGSNTKHIHYFTYPPEMQDMSGKNNTASFLDSWVLTEFESFIDFSLNQFNILEQPKMILFFHLLGADVAGHASKPNSKEYNHTLKNMDRVVKEICLLTENVFNDDNTTYLFTSDHGMTSWGSHGTGSKIETETPIIVWGAGIRRPEKAGNKQNAFPDHWNLGHLLGQNINQADIAVLMSVLLGISIPVHSVGILPLEFLDFNDSKKAEAFLLNARQLLTQLKAKERDIKLHLAAFFFKPYPAFLNNKDEEYVSTIQNAINDNDFLTAENLTRHLISASLEGIEYYHLYFQNFLLISIVLSFLGVSAIVLGDIMISYNDDYELSEEIRYRLNLVFCAITICTFSLSSVDALPSIYFLYILAPVYLWKIGIFHSGWILKFRDFMKCSLLIQLIIYGIGIEIMVYSFYQRWFLSLALLGLCLWPIFDRDLEFAPKKYKYFWAFTCMSLSIFPLLPIVGGEERPVFKISTGCVWISLHIILFRSTMFRFLGVTFHHVSKLQLGLTPLLLWNIHTISTSFREGEGLHLSNQLISFFLLFILCGVIPIGTSRIVPRFIALSYSVGLSFLLFSSSYEALFPLLLAANLMCWILFERFISLKSLASESFLIEEDEDETRSHHDFRRSFFFVFYIILSFFGIGNLASLNSFDMVWVRSFITIFSPFLMMSLVLLKITFPFILVTAAFRLIIHITRANIKTLFLIVLLICDFMAMHFLFAIETKGSWLDIGTSISHFVIMMTIVLFLLILFHLTKYLTTNCISPQDYYCDYFLGKWHYA